MDVSKDAILYRAHRLRFILVALFLVPLTVGVAALGYDGIFVGDSDVSGAWLTVPLGALFIWFDYMIAAKIIRPPELEISLQGIRWANDAMLQWNTVYRWQDVDGPEQSSGAGGVPLLRFVVRATGKKLELPPSHFGATYDEMAAVISAARKGRVISRQQWRSEHPQHSVRSWLLNWGLPIGGAIAVAIALSWFKH